MSEKEHHYNESADKVRIQTKVKRGTGTRDQDTHTLKARGETPEEAATMLSDTVRKLEEYDVFERVRQIENDNED